MHPHFEPEPHTIGTGWGFLFCAAAFGLGVIAAADGNDNQLLGPRISAPLQVLRVCADPNNLPFSDRVGEGLLRDTLEAGLCDVPGLPTDYSPILTSLPPDPEPIAAAAPRTQP